MGVNVICAETDEEAQQLAASGRMAFSLLRQGHLIEIPPVEKALRYWESRDSEPRAPGGGRRRAIIGSPETVRAGLEEVAQEYQAQELTILTITYEHAARRRSYELVAEAMGLGRQASRSAAGA